MSQNEPRGCPIPGACSCPGDDVLDTLYSVLNIEHAALLGGQTGACQGLDVPYHFEKVRAMIRKLEGR